MDLENLALQESKAVTDREQHKTSLQLDERQLDQRHHDLELKQRQMEPMQQQRIQDVVTVPQPAHASAQQTLLFQTEPSDPTPQQPLQRVLSSSTPTPASTMYLLTYGD